MILVSWLRQSTGVVSNAASLLRWTHNYEHHRSFTEYKSVQIKSWWSV